MADFKTHVATSCTLGAAYATYGALHGVPIEAAMVAGGLCGVGGMLPDIDSDSGVPLREFMGFAAAVTPVLLVERFAQLGFNYEQMVLASAASYLFVRFGVAKILMRWTVHRGMFHSIPALLIFTGLAFLLCGSMNLQLRYFKAGGVFLGVLSHLALDEIFAVEWTGGRWRFKKSFGTALKLWGDDAWGNVSTYAKLALVAVMILSEPAVMQRYGKLTPIVVDTPGLRQRLGLSPNDPLPPTYASAWPGGDPNVVARSPYESGPLWGGDPRLAQQPSAESNQPQRDRTIYDTARRFWQRLRQ
jgi:membrane-bound metal-dependent hydrolase YbcI (DUF457 family)